MTTDNRRYAFLSATILSKQYKAIPSEVVDNCVLIFGSKRSWLFPTTLDEMLEARNNPAKYLEFDEDCKSLILRKETQNLAFWLLPEGDYKKLSAFLEKIVDPTSGKNYLPLRLDEGWWQTEFSTNDSKYASDGKQVVANFKAGEFDYDAVMELLYQSNPTLVPTLYWAEG